MTQLQAPTGQATTTLAPHPGTLAGMVIATLAGGIAFPTFAHASQSGGSFSDQLGRAPYILTSSREIRREDAIATDPRLSNLSARSFTPSQTDLTLARLRQFQSWGANWDAEGAQAPNVAAIEIATDLLSLIANYSAKARLRVAMCPEGLPIFFLTRDKDSGEISVNEDGSIDFYFDRDDGTLVASDYDLAFNGSTLPESLIAILSV